MEEAFSALTGSWFPHERYGKVNEHNGWVPRDFWPEDWEKQAIIGFDLKNLGSPAFPAARTTCPFGCRLDVHTHFGACVESLTETQTRNPGESAAVARSRVYREVFIWPIHKFAPRMVSVK